MSIAYRVQHVSMVYCGGLPIFHGAGVCQPTHYRRSGRAKRFNCNASRRACYGGRFRVFWTSLFSEFRGCCAKYRRNHSLILQHTNNAWRVFFLPTGRPHMTLVRPACIFLTQNDKKIWFWGVMCGAEGRNTHNKILNLNTMYILLALVLIVVQLLVTCVVAKEPLKCTWNDACHDRGSAPLFFPNTTPQFGRLRQTLSQTTDLEKNKTSPCTPGWMKNPMASVHTTRTILQKKTAYFFRRFWVKGAPPRHSETMLSDPKGCLHRSMRLVPLTDP